MRKLVKLFCDIFKPKEYWTPSLKGKFINVRLKGFSNKFKILLSFWSDWSFYDEF